MFKRNKNKEIKRASEEEIEQIERKKELTVEKIRPYILEHISNCREEWRKNLENQTQRKKLQEEEWVNILKPFSKFKRGSSFDFLGKTYIVSEVFGGEFFIRDTEFIIRSYRYSFCNRLIKNIYSGDFDIDDLCEEFIERYSNISVDLKRSVEEYFSWEEYKSDSFFSLNGYYIAKKPHIKCIFSDRGQVKQEIFQMDNFDLLLSHMKNINIEVSRGERHERS